MRQMNCRTLFVLANILQLYCYHCHAFRSHKRSPETLSNANLITSTPEISGGGRLNTLQGSGENEICIVLKTSGISIINATRFRALNVANFTPTFLSGSECAHNQEGGIMEISLFHGKPISASTHIKFHFFIDKEGARYSLVLIEVSHKESYLAFRPDEDFWVPSGHWFQCNSWTAKDEKVHLEIEIRNLEFQLSPRGKRMDEMGSVGRVVRCLRDTVNSGSWRKQTFGTSAIKFLMNVGLMLGAAGIVAVIIRTCAKMYPEKTKKIRRCIFGV